MRSHESVRFAAVGKNGIGQSRNLQNFCSRHFRSLQYLFFLPSSRSRSWSQPFPEANRFKVRRDRFGTNQASHQKSWFQEAQKDFR